MKLRIAQDDDIVTVRLGARVYALAEARELKAAGFGGREGSRDRPGEWTVLGRSRDDFDRLTRAIPHRWREFAFARCHQGLIDAPVVPKYALLPRYCFGKDTSYEIVSAVRSFS